MALNTLLGQVTDEKLKKLPGRVRNPERIQQHIEAFGLHLQGVSYRGICDHFGWKGVATAQNSVRRGEILAKELDLDNEKLRLKLAAFFEELCDITLRQVKQQAEEGQITQVANNDGTTVVTRRQGVDPRLLGEAGRGAIRFAQFAGLMDADKSTSGGADVSTNVVFISPQADLTEWETKTVDVTPSGPVSGPTMEVAPGNTCQGQEDQLPVKQITAVQPNEDGPPVVDGEEEEGSARVIQRGLF